MKGSAAGTGQLQTASLAEELAVVDERVRAYGEKVRVVEEVRRVCEDPGVLDERAFGAAPSSVSDSVTTRTDKDRGVSERRRDSVAKVATPIRRDSAIKALNHVNPLRVQVQPMPVGRTDPMPLPQNVLRKSSSVGKLPMVSSSPSPGGRRVSRSPASNRNILGSIFAEQKSSEDDMCD